MKKLQLLSLGFGLLFTIDMKADDVIVNSNLNLYNPDVRKCLLDASKNEGWELKSVYLNDQKELVMVFDKDNNTKIYKTK